MKIIVDAFGGDNAPIEVLKGCILALEKNAKQKIESVIMLVVCTSIHS